MNWLIFNNNSSKDYGIYIGGEGTFNGAERDFESVSIPGRNGDLTIDNGRYKNVSLSYRGFIAQGFPARVETFRNILLTAGGYHRLEDTYHPEEYRLARFTGGFESEPKKTLQVGGFDINFDCQPQRFLKSGERKITLTASGQIVNPCLTTTKPLARVYGTGTVTIGGIPITINTANGYTDIDCDTEYAYRETVNCNGNITLTDGKFWKLVAGRNAVTLGSGVSKIEIIPRWWIL